MANSSNRRVTSVAVMLVHIELLTVLVLVLAIITLVAGRFPHSLQNLPILTFDTSSVKTQLASQGITNPGAVQDWYEPHYLSVCKGMWESASTQVKNDASSICTVTAGGYRFSLPELLAADAGLPVDSALLSGWSFAVLHTKTPFILLAVAIACTCVTTIAYFITIVTTPNLTTESPLLVPRVGYMTSMAALVMFIISSSKITVMMRNLLDTTPVVKNGVAWSTGGFYALTWVATGLMSVMFTVSVVLAFKIRPPPPSSVKGDLDEK